MLRHFTRRQFSTAIRARTPTPNQYNARVNEAAKTAAKSKMDGDSTARALDKGANSAIGSVDGSDSIHEAGHQADPVGQKTTGTGTPAFNKDGAIGKQFKADGAIGQIGEKVGGPFASDGAIGKNFNPDGAVGGTVHENLGKKE